MPILVIGGHINLTKGVLHYPCSRNSPKFYNYEDMHNAHTNVIYLSLIVYISFWCGQLLCICSWGVWRYLGTDMRLVLTPFLFIIAYYREQVGTNKSLNMYKIRLWATALLVALCTGFYSCNGDEEDEKILNDIIHEDDIFGNAFLRDLVEKYSDDVNCIYGGESSTGVWVSGIKNKHLWFICFDKKTKKQIFEWEDTEITDEVTKVYEGYGKYTDVRIERILPTNYKKTSSGYIFIIEFRYNNADYYSLDSDVRDNQLTWNKISFVNDDNSKSVSLSRKQSKEPIIKDWYKESLLYGEAAILIKET